ncbi:hypothetical protein [Pelosinus sp. UFO1]|uniref:hypothetical protein n=1 Tax=Pelosinus sp. UFO1 TaxID=484770 RepID=UPI0004D185F9|nr:hypothetical protein [Pelosinus sp. UFO1]AIF52812.1 hypothetical protein UFO1_3269 [Pelosinus sp. UFO1]
MMWLFLLLGIICLLVVIKKRSSEELSIEESDESECAPLAPQLIDGSEEEYLIAVITAAIQEFTGSGDFEVVQIKQYAQNWTLIGRQNLLR